MSDSFWAIYYYFSGFKTTPRAAATIYIVLKPEQQQKKPVFKGFRQKKRINAGCFGFVQRG